VKSDSEVAVFAAEVAGVDRYHLVCRAGLSGDSLLLHAVNVVLLGLLGVTLHSGSRIPENPQYFPMTAVDLSPLHVSFASVFEAQSWAALKS
jgi:hypothetical protein